MGYTTSCLLLCSGHEWFTYPPTTCCHAPTRTWRSSMWLCYPRSAGKRVWFTAPSTVHWLYALMAYDCHDNGYGPDLELLIPRLFSFFISSSTPFFFSIANFSSFSYSSLKVLLDVEADSYWCLTKLMDNIQDRYTFSQVAWYPYCHCPYLPLHQKISRLGNC